MFLRLPFETEELRQCGKASQQLEACQRKCSSCGLCVIRRQNEYSNVLSADVVLVHAAEFPTHSTSTLTGWRLHSWLQRQLQRQLQR